VTLTAYAQAREAVGDPETYITRLKGRLLAHGISHRQLAKRMNMCPTQLSRWMSGRLQPSLQSMLRMDEAADHMIYG